MKQADNKMQELGFRVDWDGRWFFCKYLTEDITFNVHIKPDTWETEIIVIDEDFGQPYPFADCANPYMREVKCLYDREIARLVNAGVLEEL